MPSDSLEDRCGIKFIKLGKDKKMLVEFIGGDFRMVDHMIELRNKECDEQMFAAEQGHVDPLAEFGDTRGPKKRKRTFADFADDDTYITVKVRTEDGDEVGFGRAVPPQALKLNMTFQALGI